MNAGIVFQQMLVILLVMMTGYVCQRLGLVGADNKKCLSSLVVSAFNPALLISSIAGSTGGDGQGRATLIFLVALVMFGTLIVLGRLLAFTGERGMQGRRVTQLMYIFSNLGFIGIPVIRAVLGSEYIIYVAIFSLEYNVLFYTYGYHLLGTEDGQSGWQALKALLNVGTVAAVLSLVLFYAGISLPTVLADSFTYLGDIASPMALFIIGITLGEEENPWRILANTKLYGFCAVKMFLLPMAGCMILRYAGLPEDLSMLTLIMLSMPVGNLPLLLLTERGWDCKFCSESIILTTLVSAISLPAMVFFYQSLPVMAVFSTGIIG